MLQTLFLSLAEVSAGTGLLIVLLAAFSPLADRRFSPRWRYWAWLALALRLLIPWSPVFSRTVVVSLPALTLESGAFSGEALSSGVGETLTAPGTAPAFSITWTQLAALVWLSGWLLFLLWHGIGFWLYRRKLRRRSRPVEDKRILLLLEESCREVGVKCPKLLYGGGISGPLLAGLLRPAILLPSVAYSDRELTLIFRHELVHLRRKDLWYKLLLLLTNALHWFNPLAYLMARQANADLELSCDCAVMEGADLSERLAYSETILASISAAGRPKSGTAVLTTYFWGGKGTKRLKARFQNIMEGSKRSGRPLLILLLLCTALSGGLIACQRAEESSRITFPAAKVETDIQAAAAVFDIEPFQVSIQLPKGWTLRSGEDTTDPLTCPRTPLDIYDGETRVGSIGYNTFEVYPDATEENFYRMVYNELMLPNLVTWDSNYTPVRQTETTCNATCQVASILHGEAGRMPETEPVYSPAVLAYDTELLVYVAASFEEGSLTGEQLTEIAASIRISR